MDEKEFIELLRKIGNCDDKEQMQRVIDEHNKSQQSFTNADRIRAMSDEELAEDYCEFFISMLSKLGLEFDFDKEKGQSIMLKWLKQPAEGVE